MRFKNSSQPSAMAVLRNVICSFFNRHALGTRRVSDRMLLRTLAAVPFAAIFGSTTCTFGWLLASELIQRPSSDAGSEFGFGQMWAMVSIVTLIGTVPGALFLGTPVCYALHRQLLGSGLVDHSQKMMVAARATAEKKAVGQRS